MAQTSIIDFRHLLDPRGRIVAARRAAHVARIVECATGWPAGHTLESPLGCRRRPGMVACSGRLYLRRSEVPSAVVWICPLCGDRGMVQHFGGTRWDLSFLEVPAIEDGVVLAPRDYDAIWDAETDLERRAMLARGRVEREGIRVEGQQAQVAVLRARLAERPHPRGRVTKGSKRRRIMRVRIKLQQVSPPVWRCVELPSTATLAQLHRVVQVAMGWSDSHLHCFRQGHAVYGIPTEEDTLPVIHERRVRVADLLGQPGDRLLYDYDLGDGWTHEIRLEEIAAPQRDARYPRCVRGKRACPPEDVGGPWGYAEMLARAPRELAPAPSRGLRLHERDFDPNEFDLDTVNSALRRLRI